MSLQRFRLFAYKAGITLALAHSPTKKSPMIDKIKSFMVVVITICR